MRREKIQSLVEAVSPRRAALQSRSGHARAGRSKHPKPFFADPVAAALESRAPRALVPLLLDWFAANARDLPWRRTLDPYAVWVSEIMLQQTQVKTVMPYFERWMRELPNVDALANASSEKIHKLWEGLGYYTRVRNMQRAAQTVVEKHDGQFPTNFDDVLALPGIGRYTAGAIGSIAFNQPAPILMSMSSACSPGSSPSGRTRRRKQRTPDSGNWPVNWCRRRH